MDFDYVFGYEWVMNNKVGLCLENYGGDFFFYVVEVLELVNWVKN